MLALDTWGCGEGVVLRSGIPLEALPRITDSGADFPRRKLGLCVGVSWVERSRASSSERSDVKLSRSSRIEARSSFASTSCTKCSAFADPDLSTVAGCSSDKMTCGEGLRGSEDSLAATAS